MAWRNEDHTAQRWTVVVGALLSLLPLTACGGDTPTASVDAGTTVDDVDSGAQDGGDVPDEDTTVECNAETAYGDWPPEFGVGPAQAHTPSSDAFTRMAVVSRSDRQAIVFLLDNGESVGVGLPAVLAADVATPPLGLEVEVTFACSPAGTWCIGDAYMSVRNLKGRLVFEGGEVAALDWLEPEIKDRFLMRYDTTPASEPCTLHTETNSQTCDRSATPVHVHLLQPDTLVASGQSTVVDIGDAKYLFYVVRAYDIEDNCAPFDTIIDWGRAMLIPILE